MQIYVQSYLKRITDVEAFLDANAAPLAPVAKAAQLRALLDTQNAAIVAAAQAQGESGGDASQGVVLKNVLLDAVSHDLDDMARAAKAIEISDPGFASKFVLPPSRGEQAVMGAARLFVANASPPAVQAEFESFGMPASFLTDLQADIAAFDARQTDNSGAVQARIASLKQLEDAISASSQTVDQLDAIMHFVFAHDILKLSAWNTAKRLEKVRAHRVKPTPPPTPSP